MHMLIVVTELPEGLPSVVSLFWTKTASEQWFFFFWKYIFAFDARDGLARNLSGSLGASKLVSGQLRVFFLLFFSFAYYWNLFFPQYLLT
jgi:hypothetical protein